MLARILIPKLLALAAVAASPAQALTPWTLPATPPLALADFEGKSHRLADYRGQVVLINFWATWCAPCREEMPSLERLRVSLQGRPFVILAVNLAEPDAHVRRFLDAVPVRFPILMDRDAAVARAWQARLLPVTYVVGPDGTIRYRHLGELDWSAPAVSARIMELLK